MTKLLLRVAVSVGLLGWLALRMDWDQMAAVAAGLRPGPWLIALAVFLASQVVSAWRWRLLSAPLGFTDSYRRFAGVYFVGMYFNLLLPTSVGGDVARVWYLDQGRGKRLSAFLSVMVDRLNGLSMLFVLAATAALAAPVGLPRPVAVAVWTMAAGFLTALLLMPVVASVVPPLLKPLPHGLRARLTALAASLAGLHRVYRPRPGLLLKATMLSGVVQSAGVLQVALVGMAAGLDVPLIYYGVAVPVVTLLTLLPVSLNGMGVREAGLVALLAPAGVTAPAAAAVGVLTFAVTLAGGLVGGLVYLGGRFARPGQGRADHDNTVGGDSGQGRAGQPEATARQAA